MTRHPSAGLCYLASILLALVAILVASRWLLRLR